MNDEILTRIGFHIYNAYQLGVIDFQIAEESLATVNALCTETWLGMPEPDDYDDYEEPETELYRGDLREDWGTK